MNTMIEIYDRIMGVVEEVTGISKDKILTSNCEVAALFYGVLQATLFFVYSLVTKNKMP